MNRWLERQSAFVLGLFLVLSIGGAVALSKLPVSLFPTIDFPRISIALEAGDRPADQMIIQVSRPAEEALRSIPGVQNIRSQTSRGSAEVSVMFEWGHDMTAAVLQSESALARLAARMPAGFTFAVRRMDPTIFPVLGYSITSESNSLVALKNFAVYQLRPLLASIDGVAEVSVLGGRDSEYQVLVDPARLASLGLSIVDVEASLRADNLVSSVGRFEDQSRLFLTLVDDRLAAVDEIGSVVLKSASGTVVELDDVATVRIGLVPDWTRVTANGSNAVLVNIRQAPDANSLALTDAVKSTLQAQSAHFPPGISFTPYYDQSDLVRAASQSVRDAIIVGTILAGIVLFVFLRSIRFVMIVAIVLPSVLAVSALLVNAMNMSLNIMTLGGMAAAVGLVVDDIVVMLEHITRRLKDGTVAALAAASEMTRPLVGSSLATIIVFTPLAFLSGVTGAFFKALAITMAAALSISMLFGLSIVPLLARRFARKEDADRSDTSNKWLRALAGKYEWLMHRLLRRPIVAGITIVSVAIVCGGLASRYSATGFMPQMDEGGFVLDYVAPAGLSLSETDRLVQQLEQLLQSVPEVASYSRRTGVQLGGGLTEANEGDLFVRLVPPPRRGIESIMSEVRRRTAASVPGLEIETIQLMGDLIGDLTAVPQPIEVKLYAAEPALLTAAADETVSIVNSIPGVVEVTKSDRVAGDAVVIRLDRARLALEGLDPNTVATQLQQLVDGVVTGTIQSGERNIDIRLWTAVALRDRVAALKDLMLSSNNGRLLRLDRVATIEVVSGQAQLSRENLQSMTAVTGRLEGRDMGSVMRDVTAAMRAAQLPPGVRVEFGGLYAEQQRSFRDLMSVFVAALTLSGLLLLFLFRDPGQVLAVLVVVGLSVAGVLCGLVFTATELNIAAMMGLTMVVGIVSELGVFYFAELGAGARNASERIAAGSARLRPILMSAVIAILALSPLALRIGEGAGLLAPMAIAIISGMLVGAPAVLLVTPILDQAFSGRRV